MKERINGWMDEVMTVAASSHIASVLCDVTGQSAYIEQNADTASSRIINLEKSSNYVIRVHLRLRQTVRQTDGSRATYNSVTAHCRD